MGISQLEQGVERHDQQTCTNRVTTSANLSSNRGYHDGTGLANWVGRLLLVFTDKNAAYLGPCFRSAPDESLPNRVYLNHPHTCQ